MTRPLWNSALFDTLRTRGAEFHNGSRFVITALAVSEERVVKAPAGSFALVPPGVVHTFSNGEDIPATFLSLLSPSGLERFLEELAAMMQQETTWPPADMGKYITLNTKYGIYPPAARSK